MENASTTDVTQVPDITQITVTTVGPRTAAERAAIFMNGAEEQGCRSHQPLTVAGLTRAGYSDVFEGVRYGFVGIIQAGDLYYVLGVSDPYAPLDTDPAIFERQLRIIRLASVGDFGRVALIS